MGLLCPWYTQGGFHMAKELVLSVRAADPFPLLWLSWISNLSFNGGGTTWASRFPKFSFSLPEAVSSGCRNQQ